MNYQGTEMVYIYAPDPQNPSRLEGGSGKRMWTYVDGVDEDGRPRLVAKYGQAYVPVQRRAGQLSIVVGREPVRAASDERRVTNEGGEATNDERRGTSGEKRPRPESVAAAVAEMVEIGKAWRPKMGMRLDSAAELVLLGKVRLLDPETAKVGVYEVTAESCKCMDFGYRGGWCKHRLAVRMARHLAAHGFEVPTEEATGAEPRATTPQISAANLALIASGAVIDEERRSQRAYLQSEHGARTAVVRMLGNGAKSVPAGLAQRAGMGSQMTNDE
jgi:hypothetical protein